MSTVNFPSQLLTNGVAILDCLSEGDLQTGARLWDEMRGEEPFNGTMTATYLKVGDRQQFFDTLHAIHAKAFDGYRPIIHIEAHGDADHGLCMADKSFVSWPEFAQAMLNINWSIGNQLCVVLAACYGAHAVAGVDITKPCPYRILIGEPDEVSAGSVQESFLPFYRELMNKHALSPAIEVLGEQFISFQAEIHFLRTFIRVYHAQSIGRRAEEHVEKLVSRAVKEFAHEKRHLPVVRKALRENNRRPIDSYERLGNDFLHGQLKVPYDEMETVARSIAGTLPKTVQF